MNSEIVSPSPPKGETTRRLSTYTIDPTRCMSDSANDELEYRKTVGRVCEEGSVGFSRTPPGWIGMAAMVEDVWKASIKCVPESQSRRQQIFG